MDLTWHHSSGGSRGLCALLRLQRASVLGLFLGLTSTSFWRLQAFLRLWPCHSDLCLCLHDTFSSVCVKSHSACLFYLFNWLCQVLVASCRTFHCGTQTLELGRTGSKDQDGVLPRSSFQSLGHMDSRVTKLQDKTVVLQSPSWELGDEYNCACKILVSLGLNFCIYRNNNICLITSTELFGSNHVCESDLKY